jgi:hypothetical protein
MEGLQEKYEQVLKESQESPEIIGLFLGGSRGKSKAFLTQYSDMDGYVVLSDNASEELESKFKAFESDGFEIRVYRLAYFKEYASWGSVEESDRYNFAHNKAVLDKTGEIQKIMDEKGRLPTDVQTEVVKKNLDSYYNQFYRSSKYTRDGKELAAYLDAVESLPFLEIALYALEGRVRPHNKYFEWELKNYPLVFLPWTTEEFISNYKHILQTGDFNTQLKIYSAVKKLFEEKGFNSKITDWIGDVLGSK